MNSTEYASQVDNVLALFDTIKNMLSTATMSPDEWKAVRDELITQIRSYMGNDKDVLGIVMQSYTISDPEESCNYIINTLTQHFSDIKAMLTRTSQLMGQFGITDIKFL